MTADPSALGCVVLAYGRGGQAATLLRSLPARGVPLSSVVVVHNPARPDDPDLELPGAVEVLRMPRNRGYAAGMNAGIVRHLQRPEIEHVLLLTHDVRLRDGCITRLLAAAQGDPSLGALGPVLIDGRDGSVFSYGMERVAGGVRHRRSPPRASVARCDALDGSVMLLRAEALRTAALFDERFFMYFEETDLCLRIARTGRMVAVVTDAVAEQESGLARRPAAFGYLMVRNGLEVARRAGGARGVAMAIVRLVLLEHGFAMWPTIRSRGRKRVTAYDRARLAGGWVGLLAFLTRRFGPPPAFLVARGDISGAA
jgi:GT2 family glycosyltransferase